MGSVQMGRIVAIFVLMMLIATTANAKVWRIYGVQSYTMNHICGTPQLEGFKAELERLNIKYTMRVYYMKSRTVHTTSSELAAESQWILNRIKAYKPDAVVLFDDAAFQYIAPKLPNNIIIVFSGMNNYYKDYLKKYPQLKEHTICGVQEIILLNKLAPILSSIDEVVILYGSSATSHYALVNFLQEFKKISNLDVDLQHRLKITLIKVKTLDELQSVISKYNSLQDTVLLVLVVQRVFDEVEYKYLQSHDLLEYVNKHNTNQLTLFMNLTAIKYVTITIGPNFYEMGSIAADLLQQVMVNKSAPSIVIANSYLYASKTNMENVNKIDLLEKYIEVFDEIRP